MARLPLEVTLLQVSLPLFQIVVKVEELSQGTEVVAAFLTMRVFGLLVQYFQQTAVIPLSLPPHQQGFQVIAAAFVAVEEVQVGDSTLTLPRLVEVAVLEDKVEPSSLAPLTLTLAAAALVVFGLVVLLLTAATAKIHQILYTEAVVVAAERMAQVLWVAVAEVAAIQVVAAAAAAGQTLAAL